ELADRAQRLGTLWGNAVAVQGTLDQINDPKVSVDERIKAIQAVRKLKTPAARDAVLKLLAQESPEPLVLEAIRALGEIGGDTVGDDLVHHWKTFAPESRRAAAEVLASRHGWTLSLLSALEAKTIFPNEIPATVIRTLGQSGDDATRQRVARDIGR